ncbi:MAG TPA: acyl-CoA dehydrogenase family protein [Solirubrobacteraceae bacterium]|nr:acyl-CoA dehydrogenase family protein [Solirubrobacteraceae bacterium]
MDFGLTDGQRALQARIREGAEATLTGDATAPERRERWRAAGELGLLGLCVPAEYGGQGLGALDTAIALEAFGRACPDTGFAFALSAHLLACLVPIAEHATDEAREELLPGLVRGDLVAANAMTEDEAGSDVSAIATTARPDGDAYVLDGEKSWASNAPEADVLVTYAVTDPHAGFLGQSAFAVPASIAGVTRGAPLGKMGLEGCLAGRVHFDGARVPERYRLGPEGSGSAIFQGSMGWERSCLFAIYLGMMERQIEACVRHARSRRQFGARLSDRQAITHRVAEMVGRLESSRLLLYRACWALDRGGHDAKATALSKVAVSESAVANALDAVQLLGARGYATDGGTEAQLRDAVPARIFSGTSEIQRELIAKGAGL